jgi:hypothetical protein
LRLRITSEELLFREMATGIFRPVGSSGRFFSQEERREVSPTDSRTITRIEEREREVVIAFLFMILVL